MKKQTMDGGREKVILRRCFAENCFTWSKTSTQKEQNKQTMDGGREKVIMWGLFTGNCGRKNSEGR